MFGGKMRHEAELIIKKLVTMKKISLFILGAVFSMNVSAQDLGVKDVIVKSKVDTGWLEIVNDTIITGDTLHLGVLFENQAGAFINKNDSITFGVTINGITVGVYGGTVDNGLPSTMGYNTIEMIIKKDQVFTTPIAAAKVCAYPIVWSNGSMGGSVANDTGCTTFTIMDKVIPEPKDTSSVLSIAGIKEISSFIGFSNNELVISTGDVVSDLKIFDLTGKVVSTTSDISSNTVHTYNLNDLPFGIYIATYGSEYFKFSK